MLILLSSRRKLLYKLHVTGGGPSVRSVNFSFDWIFIFRLEDLWLNDNQIASLEGMADIVSGSKEKITTIYLENNPCVST